MEKTCVVNLRSLPIGRGGRDLHDQQGSEDATQIVLIEWLHIVTIGGAAYQTLISGIFG